MTEPFIGAFKDHPPGTIETYTGRAFSLTNPDPSTVCIADIAHALANICRFCGHCGVFYSVAQHCCLVHDWIAWRTPAIPTDEWPKLLACALLHDAEEAYCQDLTRPLKSVLHEYHKITRAVNSVILARFGLADVERAFRDYVKRADNAVVKAEARDLMKSRGRTWTFDGVKAWPEGTIVPLAPMDAKEEFLGRMRVTGVT